MRILALGPQDVYPPSDGGKEGIFGALSALASRANVVYAYPSAENCEVEGYKRINVQPIPLLFEPKETWKLILYSTLRIKPFKFEKYATSRAVRALLTALPKEHFDAIVCHHSHMYGLAKHFVRIRRMNIPVIVREHNVEYELVDSYKESLKGLKRFAASIYACMTRREESRIWKAADAVAFLTDRDLQTAQALCSTDVSNLILAREGVPLPSRRQARYPGPQAPLLVLLNPKALQSVDNLRNFIWRCWLPLRNQHRLDNEELHVTGVSNQELSRLIELDISTMIESGIKGLGFIPTLKPIFEQSLALVSPTYVGGGIRKKILEAMAHQLPVIATDLDIATCNYFKTNVNILCMLDANSFAENVARLRSDHPHWIKVSENARDTVEEFASWDGYGNSLIKAINDILEDHVSSDKVFD